MSYITQQDLTDALGEDKLIQLTDDAGSGVVGEARVSKAISYAVGTFESYARTRYTLPVPATEKVKSICLDLALYKLQRDRMKTQEQIDNLTKALYAPTIKFLEALSGGKAALDVPAAQETATTPASPDKIRRGSTRTVFSDESLKGF